VPLTEYQGGGAAATIEPLKDHLAHYEQRLANLFGQGVMACFRGPRLYDTNDTRAVVAGWVEFYKRHRAILISDVVHVRRPDVQDVDGWLHVNPHLQERGLAMIFNPTALPVNRTIALPMYYTGLNATAWVQHRDDASTGATHVINRYYTVNVRVHVPAQGYTWLLVMASKADAASTE